ncbi:TRAM domain-containing protein [Halopenitus persicus]|uniref:TRAM domain-containing protein n=1 Tax=Halopenitus persicus TaxID=1048396 RepID=UPI000BBB431A|nr:TRAM domain-containing protein [Halopenitus persicus]
MVKIPNSLRSVFSATVQERDGGYVVEIPVEEVTHDAVTVDQTYRVAILDTPPARSSTEQDSPQSSRTQQTDQQHSPDPPVAEGEIRDVTIETIGDQGDGIAKVERGYVVIVPGSEPGQQPIVEIEQVQENVAFASVVEDDSQET